MGKKQIPAAAPETLTAPIADMLRAAQNRMRLAMPGHKGRALPGGALDVFAFDTTELPCTDDLFAPTGAIAEAERLAALAAGAAHTILLSGGSTAGVLAMVLTTVPPGGELILARNCHHSALNACVLGDVRPVFVYPRQRAGLAYLDAADVAAAIAAHPKAAAVFITRPDYFGICADLPAIAQSARAAGMKLLVDEAHGAHLNWQLPGQPENAGRCGAELWVQSAHKTLPALTSGAFLHAGGSIDAARLRAVLRLVHTSSPSFPIMASLDMARAYMDVRGAAELAALHTRIAAFWQRLHTVRPALKNAHDVLRELPGQTADPARIVIETGGLGYTGVEVAAFLAAHCIDVEMADSRRVVLIPSVNDSLEALTRVAEVLGTLPPRRKLAPDETKLPFTETVLPPRQAALAPGIWVPLKEAAGRIAAGSAGAYPPGVPLVVPGERITPEIVAVLSAAQTRFGVANQAIYCLPE